MYLEAFRQIHPGSKTRHQLQASPALVGDNLDGIGHDFYVDEAAGFTPAQQTDLINFLLALDDDPGRF